MSTQGRAIRKIVISTSSQAVDVTVRRGEETALRIEIADALGISRLGKLWSVRLTPEKVDHWLFNDSPLFLQGDALCIADAKTIKFDSPEEGNTLAETV